MWYLPLSITLELQKNPYELDTQGTGLICIVLGLGGGLRPAS